MALSTEAINLVKQKARIALAGAAPFVQDAFKALWFNMATHKSNPDLQIVTFADLGADAVAADVACKLYAIYVKKQATATDAFFKIFDDATNDATAGDAVHCIGLLTSGEEAVYMQPKGFDLTTGLVYGSYTALVGSNGSTPSTSGDGPDGFIIFGAA